MKTPHLNRKRVYEVLRQLPDMEYTHYAPTSIKSFPHIYLSFKGYQNIRYAIYVCFTQTKKELDESKCFESCYLYLEYTHPITKIQTGYSLSPKKISTYEDYKHLSTCTVGFGGLPEFNSDEEFIEIIKQLIFDINNHPWDQTTFNKYHLKIQ